MKKDAGFTLVELMVVVGIIGILAAIAIPNFTKYQAKSKTSEAKLQLSSLYMAEMGFFMDNNTYATCLPTMGYDPSPQVAQRYYAVGFRGAYTGGIATCPAGVFSFPAGKPTIVTAVALLTHPSITGIIPPGSSFVAGAEGCISTPCPTRDVWTINQDKAMAQPSVGY